MDVLSTIYYDDNTNLFHDEDGIEYGIPDKIMPFDMVMLYKKVGGTFHVKDLEYDEEYDIEFPTSRSLNRKLHYDEVENVMYDEYGDIVFNIFSIITPNDLYLFKKKKEYMVVTNISGGIAELDWCVF